MSRRTDPVVDADEAGGAGTLSLLEERRGRREELESRVRGVEEKVSQYVEVAAERGSSLRDDVKQLEEGLGTCRVKREVLAERKRKELDLVEGNIAGALGEERETRKESHRQLVRFVEEKAQVLKAGLVTARTAREETTESTRSGRRSRGSPTGWTRSLSRWRSRRPTCPGSSWTSPSGWSP